MAQRTFLRNDGWFQPVTAGDIGVSTTTTTGFLTYFAGALSSDVALASTATTFALVSVTQGTTGTWLVLSNIWFATSAGSPSVATKISDGTTVIAANEVAITGGLAATLGMSGIISNPVGNITLSAITNNGAGGVIAKAATIAAFGTLAPATTLTVIRIG